MKEKGETPYLVCRIGELWELSNHRFGRAKRMLGNFYYDQNDFSACIPHYKEAVGGWRVAG